jgi:hypothetical protein
MPSGHRKPVQSNTARWSDNLNCSSAVTTSAERRSCDEIGLGIQSAAFDEIEVHADLHSVTENPRLFLLTGSYFMASHTNTEYLEQK